PASAFASQPFGYCWRIYCKVLEVLLLAYVFQAFCLPRWHVGYTIFGTFAFANSNPWPRSRRRPLYTLLAYSNARRGGLRGAGGIATAPRMAANIERGFCPKNRSAAVVPSGRVRKKLCTAVRHARFLGGSSPRSW